MVETKTIQLNIHLQETDCERIIQCPDNFSFEMLHYVIQDSFGWENEHLYQFTIFDKKKKKPICVIEKETEESFFGSKMEKYNADEIILKQFFNEENKYFVIYEYDFGDSWEHLILFEKAFPFDETKQLVYCVGGAKKCPPEDCGGIPGYYNILDVLKNKKENDEEDEILEWLGDYDPESFDIEKTNKLLNRFKMKKETPKLQINKSKKKLKRK